MSFIGRRTFQGGHPVLEFWRAAVALIAAGETGLGCQQTRHCTTTGVRVDRKTYTEQLWLKLFANPDLYWDFRYSKRDHRHPDFRHWQGGDAMWVDHPYNPRWLPARLATLKIHDTPPGRVFRAEYRPEYAPKTKESQGQNSSETSAQGNAGGGEGLQNAVGGQGGSEPLKDVESEDEGGSAEDELRLLEEGIGSKNLAAGKRMQRLLASSKYDGNLDIRNTLIRLFAECGSLVEANEVFQKISDPDTQSWQAIIKAHADLDQGKEALKLFQEMERQGGEPDVSVYAAVLKACAKVEALAEGRDIHERVVDLGFEEDPLLSAALLEMYARCGSLEEARMIFSKLAKKELVSWNEMLTANVRHGHPLKTLELFQQMHAEGVTADKFTYVAVLNACGILLALDEGKRIHGELTKGGLVIDKVLSNALLNMYMKCWCQEEAVNVFDGMSEKDLASWNIMIEGYVEAGDGDEALGLFQQMQREGMSPDKTTFVNCLKACSSIASVEQGKHFHSRISTSGLGSDLEVGNILVDMYVQCASLNDARRVFNKLSRRNVVSWNAMISGCSLHGQAEEGLQLFKQMQEEGVKPNEATMVSVLSACCRAGLVDEGYSIFRNMDQEFGIVHGKEHYVCMVEILSRAGNLPEVDDLISAMPFQPEAETWMTVLVACQSHGNLDLGRRVFDSLVKLEPGNDAAYGLMASMYCMAGRKADEEQIRQMMRDAGVSSDNNEGQHKATGMLGELDNLVDTTWKHLSYGELDDIYAEQC